MSEVVKLRGDQADLYASPPMMRPAVEDARRIVSLAARMHRWREMETAIDVLIERQQIIVRWWDDHVRAEGHQPTSAGAGLVAAAEAERLIDLRHQQISRFRLALADIAAYRDRLVRRARREAGTETGSDDPSALRPQPTRDGPDFWPTPHSLVEALVYHVLPLLPKTTIWECAAGDGRLVQAMMQAGREVFASDLYPQDDSQPWDFLGDAAPPLAGAVAVTNPPFNAGDDFIDRGLALLDAGAIVGLVLLLRHDHLQAAGRAEALNAATFEVHCNWRPVWIEGTDGQPRWAFTWVGWTGGRRRAPIYLTNGEPAA
jgi:hypothetical protein